jgi:hypothetical protein
VRAVSPAVWPRSDREMRPGSRAGPLPTRCARGARLPATPSPSPHPGRSAHRADAACEPGHPRPAPGLEPDRPRPRPA